MKIRTKIIALAFFAFSPILSLAQTLKSVHSELHRQLLANSKANIDRSVINDFFRLEIEERESIDNQLSENEEMINDLLSVAKEFIGTRYRAGSKGPNAFDCSGFSGYVFKQFGYTLGASSRDQFRQGIEIDKKELRPGDLVFFTGRNSASTRVGHVGIVIEADNETGGFKFIHASTSGGVKIDSNTGYYGKRYIGAKRIIE